MAAPDAPEPARGESPPSRRSHLPLTLALLGLMLLVAVLAFIFIWPPGGRRATDRPDRVVPMAASRPNPAAGEVAPGIPGHGLEPLERRTFAAAPVGSAHSRDPAADARNRRPGA